MLLSADPGLRQGKGGAWDNRRCGTCFEVAVCLHGPQLQATGPSHLFFTAFKPAVCPHALKCPRMPCPGSSPSYKPQPSVLTGVQGCRLPAPKCFRRPCQGNSRSYRPQPSVLKGVQGCRLPAPQMLPQALPGQRSQLQAPAICFEGRSRLPFAGPQMLPQALPRQLSQLQAPAICF